MRLVTRTDTPASRLMAEIARARQAGELIERAELTREEYDALVEELEGLGFEIRGRGGLQAFEGVPLFVDGKPAAMLASGIQIPTRAPANGRQRGR